MAAGALKYFVQAELVHARFAMLGAAGIVLPGLATKAGALNVPDWWVAGEQSIKASGIPLGALVMVQLILMGWVEGKRIQDFKNPGSQGDGTFLGVTDGFKGQANGYPGGFFDPMGMDRCGLARVDFAHETEACRQRCITPWPGRNGYSALAVCASNLSVALHLCGTDG